MYSRRLHSLVFHSGLATLCCVFSAGCHTQTSVPAKKQIWRFAIEESEGSVQHEYALRFKQEIERRLPGQVEVVIYPYGTLGTSTHVTEQLNLGIVQFAMASPGSLGKFIPEVQVFLLHYILPKDEGDIRTLLSDPRMIEDFDRLYAPKGLRLLSIFSEGPMVWTTKQEIRCPADFRGVKMRVMTSPLLLAAYNAYGASATPTPYSEVYSGLQLNMIDGQVNPVFAIERQKFHEVTSWMIFPGHTSFITTCAANRKFFDQLPIDQKTQVEEVFRDLDETIVQFQSGLQSERLKTILRDKKLQQGELHIIGDLTRFLATLTPEEHKELVEENPTVQFHAALTEQERREFREASQPVREAFLKIGGQQAAEVLEQLLSASDRQ